MLVIKAQLRPILAGQLDHTLVPVPAKPLTPNQPIKRPKGQIVCRAMIRTTERVRLDDLTDADAIGQGFPSVDVWRDEWCRTHDAVWTGGEGLWVRFVVLPQREPARLLRFGGGYTEVLSQTVDREASAVDPAEVANGPTATEARQRWDLERAWADSREFSGSLGERLDRVLAEARRSGVDASGAEWLLRRKIEQLEHRNRRAA